MPPVDLAQSEGHRERDLTRPVSGCRVLESDEIRRHSLSLARLTSKSDGELRSIQSQNTLPVAEKPSPATLNRRSTFSTEYPYGT